MKNQLGKIHIYTGNGKGKTTAALGLAVRAAGAGLSVCLIQFMKAKPSSELKILKAVKNITVYRFGEENFITKAASADDFAASKKAYALA